MKPVACSILVLGLWGLASPNPLLARVQTSTFDDLWQFAEWYDNDQNPVVQSVLFSGRFQYEYARVNDSGVSRDQWNVRRLRLGVRSRFFGQFTVHGEAEFNPQESDPFYVRLTDFYVQWSPGASFAATVGKHGVPFTMDGSTSSKELLTIDRSNLTNNMWFTQEYMPGVSFSGELSNWRYHVGAYSAGSGNREFGEFDGSAFSLVSLGYDFGELLGTQEATLSGNYIYQNPDPNNTFTRQLQHVASLNFKLEDARWGTRADVSTASGYLGQSDLWGTMVMPYYNLTSKLQVVGRHTYLNSEGANGIRLARYENLLTSGRGDRYNEIYLGVNYFLYGHKLKLQSGLQIADMDDAAADGGSYSGTSLTTGLRVSW